ncbi:MULTISPECIES: hypothetical protein [Trichocoleus]|uniref:Uncharacterized protein n=1 Tax=Trichocoleus desertorum GB2-A4 TaxID=2933944 RepID=A0ABV0J707_9CYAN|nr:MULTISPECIES: hypothetical protein [unclassified Trichocoleus]MBD1863756.1 hypothetical protein [Trichocoleus sp. FACHB-46]MBD2095300.1 hypothetical protein [Trichocoleus sp. FACHB-591]MBD2121096.1 hypothetical protein [Trichocoleus sp. FACHB-262]
MNNVSDLVVSRGCLLKTETINDQEFYWLESPHFTSKLYSNLEELTALVQTLPITFSSAQHYWDDSFRCRFRFKS